MAQPEAKKSNRTLLFAGIGCVLLACICLVCSAVGYYFYSQGRFSSLGSQFGVPSGSNPSAAQPTGAPIAPPISSGAPTSSAPRTSPTTASQPSGGSNSVDALTKSFTSWGAVKSFRAKISTAGTPEMTMEMVLPDKMHMIGNQFEMILISDTSYVKVGGTWQKMKMPQAIDVNMFNPKTYETQIQNVPDIKIIGPDNVDGYPCIAYQITPKGGSASTTSKFWIGVADGFPHKIESGNATITFSDFNGNIVIDAPIK